MWHCSAENYLRLMSSDEVTSSDCLVLKTSRAQAQSSTCISTTLRRMEAILLISPFFNMLAVAVSIDCIALDTARQNALSERMRMSCINGLVGGRWLLVQCYQKGECLKQTQRCVQCRFARALASSGRPWSLDLLREQWICSTGVMRASALCSPAMWGQARRLGRGNAC